MKPHQESHRYSVAVRGGRFVAECTCGWTSRPTTSAGQAGAAHDRHREGLTADE